MTETITVTNGRWELECIPEDGARISRLRYDGQDLLTTRPSHFRPPRQDYGRYETRPAYGYDDCFPSCDICNYPTGQSFAIPDHGELCWLGWKCATEGNILDCHTESLLLPATFRRTLVFTEDRLSWIFEVKNTGSEELAFLHVMHPLMPLQSIAEVHLPGFGNVYDEMNGALTDFSAPRQIREHLLGLESGRATMLLLREIQDSKMDIVFNSGLRLTINFPRELFPVVGIWWNNAGYPDEEGCRRIECAFEPIPGPSSSLARSYESGTYLKAPPHGTIQWTIDWLLSKA